MQLRLKGFWFAACLVLTASFTLPAFPGEEAPAREIAVTVDDLPGIKTGGTRAADAIQVSEKIVRTLEQNSVPAVGLVAAGRAFPDDPGAPPVRYFRHPCLHTGRSHEIRAEVDALLEELHLTVAPVTFDNGEWIFAAAYHQAIADGGASI